MSNESEEMSESEPKTNFVDLMFTALGLPEMHGREMASRFVQIELLLTLKQANILSDEQINQILDRASAKASEAGQEMQNSAREKNEQYFSDLQKLRDAATKDIERLREILNAAPSPPSQSE